jgi:hypothetical protein
MAEIRETESRKLLKAKFDGVLAPLGFQRSFSTWLRNNDETSFAVNIERWPMLEAYFINLWVWFSPNVAARRKDLPHMAVHLEDLFDAELRGQVGLWCDFELDSRDPKEKADAVTRYLLDVGLPWLTRFQEIRSIREAYSRSDAGIIRAITTAGRENLSGTNQGND